MNSKLFETRSTGKVSVNWVNEWLFGSLLSAAYTVCAANAGTEGLFETSPGRHVYALMTFGGLSMTVLCGLASFIAMFSGRNKNAIKPVAVTPTRP